MIKHIVKIRQYWRIMTVVAVLAAAWWKMPVTFCAARLGILQLICPVGFIESSLATGTVVYRLLPGVLTVVVLAIALGRMFCSWTCPARLAGHTAEYLSRRTLPGVAEKIKVSWRNARRRFQKKLKLSWSDGLALLGGLFAGIALFEFPAYSIFCPVGILSRNLIELTGHFRLRWDMFFLLLPIAIGLFFNLGWKCACPIGLMQGLLAKPNRTLLPVINFDECELCGKCMQNCNFGVSLHKTARDSFSCSKCFKCLKDCNRGAIHLKPLAFKKEISPIKSGKFDN
jgi:ferredoxin-type protein NapH